MNWNRSTPQEQPEPGSHIARCISIIDLGTQQHPGFQGGQPWSSRDVRIAFELPGQLMAGTYKSELKGRPFGVSTTLKQSMHPSAKMRKLLKSWRGRDFTPAELQSFDCKKLLGQPCRLTLVESTDGQFVNIDSISPIGKGEKCQKQINPSTYFSLDPEEFDIETYNSLGEKTRTKIATSPEYKALNSAGDAQEDPPAEHYEEAPPADDDAGPF